MIMWVKVRIIYSPDDLCNSQTTQQLKNQVMVETELSVNDTKKFHLLSKCVKYIWYIFLD